MSFINPFALLAMAAVAVPLFLHFFNLRQPRTVEFSSLAFVKELQASAVQRVRIKEWLLLALRMLAIASLGMAFAQPTLTSELGGVGASAPTAHAVVVDNSLSMSAEGRGGTYFDRAVQKAQGVLGTVEEGDEALLWPTARSGARRLEPTTNTGVVRQSLAELEPRAGASSLAAAVGQAADAASQADAPQAVVSVVSDLQASTLGDSVAVEVPDGVQVQLLPVETRSQSNVSVSDVTVTSRIVEVDQPVQLEATLTNHGPDPLDDYVASVYLAGDRVAQATATLEPGLETTVSFTVTPQTRGWLDGAVVTEDDAVPVDDRHHFALHVPEERRVLMVRGEGQDTRYLDLALSSEMVADRIAFRTTAIDERELASAELGRYDAVLLAGPRSLSSGEVEALTRFVDRGGGLLLFPNAQARPEDYNALLGGLNAGSFRGFSGALSGDQTVASFEQVDLQHPLFENIFQKRRREEASVEQPDLYYIMNIRPSGRSGQTLIELSNGRPFLHEVRHGGGRLLLTAVAPTRAWSDLPVRGLFVPLLYRSVYYLSATPSVAGEQLGAGRPTELRVTGVPPEASVRLEGPDGVEVTPEQRTLFGATLVQVGTTLTTPGLYDVQAGSTRVRRVAVNVNPAESNLRAASPEDASKRLRTATGASVRALAAAETDDLEETLRTRRAGTELWNVFLLLALVFLAAEMLVASQWVPETASS
ncbi:BatA domain-containing protein [Salinibacter altiplanensis]|uniref:BatA domain-containing protein n=1 Tax=Salinibacter altiplanensis TaxID=1803181 RepID=UPI001F40777D|nr:BatA domain-containing protein [Salinibacter altiplanensis]